MPRPSSPLGAKASTRCPCFPRPTPATTAPLHPARPRPQRIASLRSTPGRTNSSNNSLYKRPSRPRNGRQSQHTHAILTRRPTDGKRGADASLASARHAHKCTRGLERNLVCPRTGFTSPPYDVQRTRSLQQAARGIMTMPQPSCGGGASLSGRPGRDPSHEGQHPKDASLVGLGRLERPTSRLSGVRSNQLSYRPESHPKDRTRHPYPSRAKASRSRRDCLAATPAGAVIGCV